jgi:hypothetical protein
MWEDDFLFCKHIDGRGTSLEVFGIINYFETVHWCSWVNIWTKCRTSGTGNKGSPSYYLDTLYASQTSRYRLFQAVIRVVNCVKCSPLRGRLIAKLYDNMEAEHNGTLILFWTHWLSCAKVLYRIFELKEETAIF